MNFKKMDLAQKKRTYLNARDAYYNEDKSFLTDKEYDALEDLLVSECPDWAPLKKTGATVPNKKTEVDLMKFMPSLEKYYPDKIERYYQRALVSHYTSWLWMDKLDGTSLQLIYRNGKPWKLITRGDGVRGGDISFFIPFLVEHGRIPAALTGRFDKFVVFRCEALMTIANFDSKWSRDVKGEEGFDNARNMVNGLFNRKEMHPALKDTDIVVLGVYERELFDGIVTSQAWGFHTCPYTIVKAPQSAANHEHALSLRRKKSQYQMDGLVVAPKRWTMHYESEDKPKQLVAFKINEEESAPEVRVLDVNYSRTRLGRWSSVVIIPPTEMDGVIVSKVTAHNGAWMQEHGVGPGAVIKVLRSGGVIPKIVGVVQKAKFKEPPGPWEMRGRFIYATEGEDKDTRVRQIHFFFTTLGIELLAEKTIDKLYDAGFKTLHDYIVIKDEYISATYTNRTWKRFVAAGIGENQAKKLITEIFEGLDKRIKLKKLMIASGHFDAGMGERKLAQLEEQGLSMATLCNMPRTLIASEIPNYKGFSDKTAKLLLEGISEFRKWYKPVKNILSVDGSLPVKKAKSTTGILSGVFVSFTGYRDAAAEMVITQLGGEVVTFGAKTTVLLYDPKGKASTKVAKAGAKAMVWEDFATNYGIAKSRISA